MKLTVRLFLLLAYLPASAIAAESLFRLQLAEPAAYKLKPASSLYHYSSLSDAQRKTLPFAQLVEKSAHQFGVDPALVHAIIKTESAYDAQALSPKGAVGLMQLMPATASQFGVRNLQDAAQNIQAGTALLAKLQATFNGRLDLALAAYNAGPGAVLRYGNNIPPYQETRDYVPRVMARYQELSGGKATGASQRIDYWRTARKSLEATTE